MGASAILRPPPPTRWPGAEVIALPLEPGKKSGYAGQPRQLVARRTADISGPNGEEMIYIDGAGGGISLFTGVGGFDLGMERAGFVTLVQHEMDRSCCETLIANRPACFRHAALIQGDIRQTPTSLLLKAANLRTGEAHLVVGGPPCQGFSTGGRRDEADPRNTLIYEFLRVVREAQPRFFVMENVPGLVSMANGRFLSTLLRQAFDGYYEIVYGLVDAVEYGVPQYRCRLFVVGTRRDLFEIDGTLAALPDPVCFSDADLHTIRTMKRWPIWHKELDLLRHPPGIRYFPDRPLLIPPWPRSHRDGDEDAGRSKTFLEFYRALRRDEPDRIVRNPQPGASHD